MHRPDPHPGSDRVRRLADRPDRGGRRRGLLRALRGHDTATPRGCAGCGRRSRSSSAWSTAIVGAVAVAAMLLTFPAMRTVGTSMLASAGMLGIVAGIAAQSTLGNLFAGMQIAFGDMVRLGDTVVVDGEWGKVDEITLTFLTVRTWDERRITMPVSYFTSKPFENWSRGGAADDRHGLPPARPQRARPRDAREAARHPARVPGLGRPRLGPGRHGHHAEHDAGPGPGHGEGRGRHLDGAGARCASS